ncbi:MAG: hypothetical protein RBT47_10155 [Anaerolineae bacterium]|jgi:hypothetical protein|nr:hypothetical protein [Anaerolineae bacterium]
MVKTLFKRPFAFWQLCLFFFVGASTLSLLSVLFSPPVTAEAFSNALYMAAILLGAATVFPSFFDVWDSTAALTRAKTQDELGQSVIHQRQVRDRGMTVTFALAAAALLLAGIAYLISA